MNLCSLLPLVSDVPEYRRLAGQLTGARGRHSVVVLQAARPFLIAALYEELGLPVLVVTAQPDDARRLFEQVRAWCSPSARLYRFPELDFLPYERLSSYPTDTMLDRLRALSALSFREHCDAPPLVVSSAPALATRTVRHTDFASACHWLEEGMTAEPMELLHTWQQMGYEMQDVVEVPGEMGKRGGIVDLFPACGTSPVRIEFCGRKIESLRIFDPESQLSGERVSSVAVTLAKELTVGPGIAIQHLNLDNCALEAARRFKDDVVRVEGGEWFPEAQFYFPLLNAGSVFEYLPEDTLLVFDDPELIDAALIRLGAELDEVRAGKVAEGELPRGFPLPYLSRDELRHCMGEKPCLSLESWDAAQGERPALPFSSPQIYGGKLQLFLETAGQMITAGQRVVVISHQANRVAELLEDEGIYSPPLLELEDPPPAASVTLLHGSLDGGWVMGNLLNLVTDAEFFGFVKQPRPSRKRPIHHQWFQPQLRPGDYVVHVDHGVGKFVGLTLLFKDGTGREYLVIEYAAGDRIFVPTEQADRVGRYIGPTDRAPALSRLGTQEWERTKRRVRESVADMAQELLSLYASRELAPGFAFSPDSVWQRELELSFPYVETPDQLEAIVAVKQDMEKARPMDRLICGDVGYGKTEVALRAAFKAVMDDKQVAILTPTTVLARQHLTTFSERLGTFPARVEMLSRFCSPQEERDIVDGLASGTVDICIATHRLLQNDIRFKDLGLLIVDEEQQFGVVQKEKLRRIRRELDTLALSATPIPRTLHMSLTGIRDISIMETPPEERLSIKTYVGPYDDALVRQVILRELDRNGQVFFVHNRVRSIARVADGLSSLVPEARVAIAHGQMPEDELDRVMSEFVDRRCDVLVTTTIIQLGLDMANVNTLVVDRANRFGLSQLYQLRGRVGRGINQAYAYFFFDAERPLTAQSRKRLRTISEATELGSGFGVAMKDLEIRGAGSLLGVKQSGHVAAVGFELYCELLAESVEKLKTEGIVVGAWVEGHELLSGGGRPSPTISLPLNTLIPEEYVSDPSTRLAMYRRLARALDTEELGRVARELRDRFGAPPQPVNDLLYAVKVKLLAARAGVGSIVTQGRQVIMRADGSIAGDDLRRSVAADWGAAVRVGTTQIRLDLRLLGDRWAEALEGVLNRMLA